MSSTFKRVGVALAATATACLGLAASSMPSAHAADTFAQTSATCQQTTDGRACVALRLQYGDGGRYQKGYRVVFTLTPKAGHYLSPTSWTTVNPNFSGTFHDLCPSRKCAKGKAWAYETGYIQRSVAEFTYQTPTGTHRIYTGSALGVRRDHRGPYSLETNTWYIGNVTGVSVDVSGRLAVANTSRPVLQPLYLRLFTGAGSTVFAKSLCSHGHCVTSTSYGLDFHVLRSYVASQGGIGEAALINDGGTVTDLVDAATA